MTSSLPVVVCCCWSSLMLLVGVSEARVHFVNGSYDGVVVALANHIRQDEGEVLIDKIKLLFGHASVVLQRAMFRSASFGRVFVLVPSSWNVTSTSSSSSSSLIPLSPWEAEVRVDEANPQHGRTPYTQQPRGCGQPGSFVHLTPDFLARLDDRSENVTAEAARLLVHSWARLRYGVFPETWVVDRPQFPTVYQTEGSYGPTACSNVALRGEWKGDCDLDWLSPREETMCYFAPSDDQSDALFSSLMSWPRLPQAHFFCDNNSHNALPPTVHNVLCNSRSVWDVIVEHDDFREGVIARSTPINEPEFVVVQDQPPTRYVLLVDKSAYINRTGHLDAMVVALTRLVMRYLPNQTEVLVMQFTDRVRNATDFTRLDSHTNRHVVRRGIAIWPSESTDAQVLEAISSLFTKYVVDEGCVFVVLSSGIGDKNITEPVLADLRSLLDERAVRMVAVVLDANPDLTWKTTNALLDLASHTAGHWLVVNKDTDYVTALAQLDAAMIFAATLTDRRLVQVKHDTVRTGHESGSFIISEDVASDVAFSVTFAKDHQLWPVMLFSPSGETYDGKGKGYHDLKDLQQVFITVPKAQSGIWTYAINFGPKLHDQSVTVTVTSEAVSGLEPIRVRGWIQVLQQDGAHHAHKRFSWPVILFAEVMRGSRPVMRAHVEACIVGGKKNPQRLQLLDAGNGDSDITKNDGVYSRYIPFRLAKGFYTVNLNVHDNRTAYMYERGEGRHLVEHPTRIFQRSVSLGTFFVGQSDDTSPPSRVTDLRWLSAKNNRLTLAWTEPGDDYDSGTVASYHFWWSDKLESLLNFDVSCLHTLLPEVNVKPVGADYRQQAVFSLPPLRSPVMFIGITATDAAKNRSPLSNVVYVYRTKVQPSLAKLAGDRPRIGQVYRGSCSHRCLSNSSLGVVVVCAIVIALVMVAVLIFVCVTSRQIRHRQREAFLRRQGQERSPDGSDSGSPVRVRSVTMVKADVEQRGGGGGPHHHHAKGGGGGHHPTMLPPENSSFVSTSKNSSTTLRGTPPPPTHRQPLLLRKGILTPAQHHQQQQQQHEPGCGAIAPSEVSKCACSCSTPNPSSTTGSVVSTGTTGTAGTVTKRAAPPSYV